MTLRQNSSRDPSVSPMPDCPVEALCVDGSRLAVKRHSPPWPITKSTTLSIASPVLRVGEDERSGAAHAACVPLHDIEAGTDQRVEIDLVDNKQIRAGDTRAAFARDLVAGDDVDDVDRQIGEFRRESCREIVAARLDEH